MNDARLAGIVLAAGRGRRMGTLKQSLPWPPSSTGSSTVASCAFDAVAPFCERMFVVVGSDADAVIAALHDCAFVRVNAESDAEMFASIQAGLLAVREHAAPPPAAVLLQPGDHPGVARATIEAMLAAFTRNPRIAVVPEYRGRGGHPALIPQGLSPSILDFRTDGGLRQFWLDHPEIVLRLPVDDPLCVTDLDTRNDYQAAWRGFQV